MIPKTTQHPIAKRIAAKCPADLKELEKSGLDLFIVGTLVLVATKYIDPFPSALKDGLKTRRDEAALLARRLEKASSSAKKFGDKSLESNVAYYRDIATGIGTHLRSNGQTDGIDTLLRAILALDVQFKAWAPLSRVIDVAFGTDGVDAKFRGENYMPDALRKRRDRILKSPEFHALQVQVANLKREQKWPQ